MKTVAIGLRVLYAQGSEPDSPEGAVRLLAGKTVLVIAHRMRTVEAADKIVVLKDGEVVEQGSPDELLQNPQGVFAHMRALQSASAGWSI